MRGVASPPPVRPRYKYAVCGRGLSYRESSLRGRYTPPPLLLFLSIGRANHLSWRMVAIDVLNCCSQCQPMIKSPRVRIKRLKSVLGQTLLQYIVKRLFSGLSGSKNVSYGKGGHTRLSTPQTCHMELFYALVKPRVP